MNATIKNSKEPNNSGVGKATPMMEQYLSIKAKHADCLLFYRMGDFYEIFFEDAVQAAAALDITLTKRGQHDGKDIPMCGVPVHARDTYLSRLIRKGFKVAVCEQMENPAEAKKRGVKSVVKRSVARIVTPGTITEDSLLDTRSHNYLAALALASNHMALAWLDMSTGSFQVQPVDAQMLATVLSRVDPGELLCPQKLLDHEELSDLFNDWGDVVTPQANARFDSTNAERRLKDFYAVKSLDVFGDFNRAELSAAGSLLDYVELTQVGQIPRLANLSRLSTGAMMEIDQASRRNLELVRTLSGDRQNSLLATIDRTVTGAGARLLGTRLSAPLTKPALINARLDMVQFYVDEDHCKSDLRAKLRETPDIERALSRLSLGRGGPRDMAAIRDGLSSNDRLRAIHSQSHIGPPIGITTALNDLGIHDILVDQLGKALAAELPLLTRDGGFIQTGYSVRLDELRVLGSESKKLILALENKYREHSGVDNLKIKHNNMLGYFIEITTRHAEKMAEPFIHRQSMRNAVRYSTLELNELARDIAEAQDKAQALEQQLFDALVCAIKSSANEIAIAAAAIAELDWASALAELAVECNYARPQIDDSHAFDIKDGRHPVVERALRSQDGDGFVANDCDLSPDHHLWLITGPNMAGKSTFLRQNALMTIMAQSGSFVPAKKAHIGAVDRLFSRVGAADDLARGRSTFMVEMVETAIILNQATDRSLVILDEIGRGTATFDGLSIAWACVEHLHEVCKSRALFATHYHELTSLTERFSHLSPHAMRVKEWQGDVIFLHEVMAGSAERSYGIHVARLAGLPQTVISRAEEVLKSLQEGEHSGAVSRLIEDLPLFQATTYKAVKSAIELGQNEVEKALENMNPDDMTPQDALNALYKLKKLLGADN